VHPVYLGRPVFNRYSKLFQFLLLSFLQLHLEQCHLVFEVGQNQVVPFVAEFTHLLTMSCFQSNHLIRLAPLITGIYLHVSGQDPPSSSILRVCAALSIFFAPVTLLQVYLHARSFCDVHPTRVKSPPTENARGPKRRLGRVLAPNSPRLSSPASHSSVVVVFQLLILPIVVSDAVRAILSALLTAGLRGTCYLIWHRCWPYLVLIVYWLIELLAHSRLSRSMSLNPRLLCRYSFYFNL